MTFDQFTSAAFNPKTGHVFAGTVLNGYFYWSSANPDKLIFGYNPFSCPKNQIPRDQIESIHPDQTVQCSSADGSNDQMWSGVVILKADASSILASGGWISAG
ncbi:MAG: hypothetical protein AAF583_09790 [Pseudomonadota bacterium]